MTPAPNSIFVVSLGNAVTKGIFFSQDKIYRSLALATKDDPTSGLSAVTKALEVEVGSKIDPGKVIITGRQSDLDKLAGQVEATLVGDDKAVAAAEHYLTQKFASPTAILDVGPSAFLERYPAEEIGRWLPFVVNLTDIENQLANKRLYPRVLPVTEHECEIDLAVARQAIIKLGQKDGRDNLLLETKLNLVLTGGLLTEISKLSDLVSVVLDSFYFKSGVKVIIDQRNDIALMGALLTQYPSSELPDLELKIIGSALHLGGVHRVSIDFGYQTKQRLVLDSGEIIKIPAEEQHQVEISVATGKSTHRYTLGGGEGGIYLDNRVRPLGVISGSKESISKILNWRRTLGAESLVSSSEVSP